ncbi:MAG: hypothetical protein AAF918_10850 [Pseudomonadota bacterium]
MAPTSFRTRDAFRAAAHVLDAQPARTVYRGLQYGASHPVA